MDFGRKIMGTLVLTLPFMNLWKQFNTRNGKLPADWMSICLTLINEDNKIIKDKLMTSYMWDWIETVLQQRNLFND